MKKCTKCLKDKEITKFYPNKNGRLGVRGRCKSCESLIDKVRSGSTKRKLYKKEYYDNNKEKQNTQKRNKYNLDVEFREKIKVHQKKYYANNKYRYREAWARYKAAKLKATIAGYESQLKTIYKNCPKEHHVDHIIPLQGAIVCGLHVPWNLQYLPAKENLSKGNKLLKRFL